MPSSESIVRAGVKQPTWIGGNEPNQARGKKGLSFMILIIFIFLVLRGVTMVFSFVLNSDFGSFFLFCPL